jgi:hypothetical protein
MQKLTLEGGGGGGGGVNNRRKLTALSASAQKKKESNFAVFGRGVRFIFCWLLWPIFVLASESLAHQSTRAQIAFAFFGCDLNVRKKR